MYPLTNYKKVWENLKPEIFFKGGLVEKTRPCFCPMEQDNVRRMEG
jgi:hypothetical protein